MIRHRTCALLGILVIASAQVPLPRTAPNHPATDEPITPIPAPPPADPAKVALGASLFMDPRLSREGNQSCLSCHDIRTNGAGSRRFDTGRDGSPLSLNTPTVFNAALNFRLNWAGNVATLEEQAERSIVDPKTMGSSAAAAARTLAKDPAMAARFQAIYQRPPDRADLLDAIAAYERSLLTPGSRFDRWLSGDEDALSGQEREGYRLFKSYGCVSCHQGVNVGGNLFERSGVFHSLAGDPPGIIRVPSLRNVAVTAPYFHDGSAPTLEKAVDEMAHAQLDRNLSDTQTSNIAAFLKTLTGVYQGHELTARP